AIRASAPSHSKVRNYFMSGPLGMTMAPSRRARGYLRKLVGARDAQQRTIAIPAERPFSDCALTIAASPSGHVFAGKSPTKIGRCLRLGVQRATNTSRSRDAGAGMALAYIATH